MKQDRLKLIEDMLDKNPDDAFLNYAAVLEYKKLEQDQKAKSLLEKINVKSPEYLAVYYQLGKLYESENSIDKAIAVYKKGLEIAKNQDDLKTFGELSEALLMIDEDFDGGN